MTSTAEKNAALALPDTAPERLFGMASVASVQTVVLVLGSFPGAASLRQQQYYGHPQNQFWPVMQALWPQHLLPERSDYAGRCAWLLARGVGLWDVYASCERSGSLDVNIRRPLLNDFAALKKRCPSLAAIAHNGAESFKHSQAVLLAWSAGGAAPLASVRLPSTSPANAGWSFDRKKTAWAELMAAHGLL